MRHARGVKSLGRDQIEIYRAIDMVTIRSLNFHSLQSVIVTMVETSSRKKVIYIQWIQVAMAT